MDGESERAYGASCVCIPMSIDPRWRDERLRRWAVKQKGGDAIGCSFMAEP